MDHSPDRTRYPAASLIEVTLKCSQKHVIHYPASFANRATFDTVYCIFPMWCPCYYTYLLVTMPECIVQFYKNSERTTEGLYRSIEWPKYRIGIGKEMFYYKKVDPTHVLIGPKRAGDPIDGPEDLLRFPLPVLEKILEIPGRPVQVENQGKGHIGYRWDSSGSYRS